MKIEELLEKKEQLQFVILRTLVMEGGTLPIPELRDRSGLSKSAFDQYLEDIESIGSRMKQTVAVRRNEYQAVLELGDDISLDQVLLFLLQESVKFNLLIFLLEHQQASIIRLATAFNLSESSVFRKIKELNQLLKEFGLQIKNGQLHGEELQIRYFYYELFQFIPEEQRPLYLQETPEKRPLFLGLERALETVFSSISMSRLSCWLGITKKRLLCEKSTFASLKDKKMLYQTDRLYQTIDPVLVMYLSRTAAQLNVYETLMFYSFFVSFSIMDEETFYQYDLTRSKKLPTAVLDTYIRETMLWHYRPRRLKIEEEKAVGYQLAQIDNEWYFFYGKVERYDRGNLLRKQKQMLGRSLSRLLDQLKETARRQLPSKATDERSFNELMLRYASVLMMIDFYIAKPVVIGIDLNTLPIYRVAFQQFLIGELKGISGIELENYEEGKDYDLVITLNPRNQHVNTYYLSEFASSYDIARLKKRIEAYKKEKN
ncbi:MULTISPECIES: helix-turn-helix domain-containing protein [unclassified Enterococcus]|uniref:helix-turn-helix domain-containing protein n=1 Tax=unclassified Enterococcus TaxID=2608891 RepID=UPI0013ED5C5B|nr:MULTISPECIES: helix-turn-helix domain-containing protein [unclassified Enterococcus]